MGGNEADESGMEGKEGKDEGEEEEEEEGKQRIGGDGWGFSVLPSGFVPVERRPETPKTHRFGIGAQSLVELLDGDLVIVNVQLLLQLVQVFLASFLAPSRVLSPKLHQEKRNKK